MSDKLFRQEAVERLSSPDQLDQLVGITRPLDWVAGCALLVGLLVGLVWGVVGRVPTRVSGEGILISSGGRVVDAISAVGGRLASVEVAVGDEVRRDQVIARVSQTETEQRHLHAVAVLRERQHEHAELVATMERELAAKAANFAAQEAGLNQVVEVATQRAEYLTNEIEQLQAGVTRGFITRKYTEDRRAELSAAKQRITDARNDILKLHATQLDLHTQRDRERLLSEFKVNDARRQVEQIASALERDQQVISPAGGRVIEIKVAAGAVLAVGTPVIQIEIEGETLEAVIYMPPDRGKNVKPGMEVRVEPTTIKREEYGSLVGKVITISEFPVTPQGMTAILHNDTLVTRFSRDGAPYAMRVRLEADPVTVSGFRWSSGTGPPLRLSSGTLARAEVTTREQPPIDLVIPVIRRLTGISG